MLYMWFMLVTGSYTLSCFLQHSFPLRLHNACSVCGYCTRNPPPHPSCSVCDHITNRVFELNIELPYVLGWIGGTATQQCWPLQSCFASFIQLLFRCCEYNLKEASQTRGVLSLQSCADYGMCAGYGKCVGRAMNWLQTTIVIVLTQQLCAGPGMCVGPHRE